MASRDDMVLITVTVPTGRADFTAQRERLGLSEDEVDTEYGAIPIDPEHGKYALRVTPAAASRLLGVSGVEGPFSNPRIEPFGPLQ